MDAPVSPRRALAFVIVGAILLAGGALFLTLTEPDPISSLFQRILTIQVIAAILICNLLAWSARRLIVGKLPKLHLNSLTVFVSGLSRVSFLIATVTVMVGWLTSLALGLEIAPELVRAVVLLVVATAFTGIIGGAVFNSTLAVRHLRGHETQ